MPREIVRTKRHGALLPARARSLVKVDRRTERGFPALLPERITALARHYDISLGETRRIAGYDCQAVVLTPKDNLRYGYRLYADTDERHAAQGGAPSTPPASRSSSSPSPSSRSAA